MADSNDSDTETLVRKYPNIEVQLTGGSGNAGAIMAAVSDALRAAGVPAAEINAYRMESLSGSYQDLLRTAARWVVTS